MGQADAASRRDDAPGNIDDWMAARWADLQRLGSDAEDAGREAWGWAARTGRDVLAPRPRDVAVLGDRYRPQRGGGSDRISLTEPEPLQEVAKPVEPGDGPDLAAPQPMDLGLRFAAARPGDSISKLLGTSDPAAVGKFLSLNGMDGNRSTIRPGRSYIVPTRWDDATESEARAGQALLGADNARLQAQAEIEPQDQRGQRNIQAGEVPDQRRGATSQARSFQPAAAWYDDSPTAKAIAGTLAYNAGLIPGVVRGGYHTLKSALDGATFLSRLADPMDPLLSAPGESAQEQVASAALRGGAYAWRGVQDPRIVRDDIASAFHDFRLKEDLTATPVAPTLRGEVKRAFDIGMNNGELAFDAGSTVAGGELLRGAAGLGAMTRAAETAEAKILAARPGLAAYLDEPYEGMGHHIKARRTRLPSILGGGPVPKELMESAFNKIRAEGMTRRDFFRNHVGVDDFYHGGKVPARFGGGGWSAKNLGWDKYRGYERFQHGTAPATKAVMGSTIIGGQLAGPFDDGAGR